MSLRLALKWSLLSELAARAVQPLVFLALARLLTPEDFGVMAAATLVVTLGNALADAGLGRALVQWQGERSGAARAALRMQAALGLAIAIAIAAAAGVLAGPVFHEPRLERVLQAMAPQVLLASLGGVPAALLQKDLRFAALFRIRVAGLLAQAAVSIPLALLDLGVWALAVGSVAGQSAQLAMLWFGSRWRTPRPVGGHSGGPSALSSLLRFGGWAGLGSLLMWVHAWLDIAVVGHFMGTHVLGLYRTGNMIVELLFATAIGSLTPVLFGYFASVQHDPARIRALLTRVQVLLTAFALPTGVGLSLFGDDLSLLLGPRWTGIGEVIAVMGLAHGLSWTMGANDEAYKAMGRPDIFVRILAVSLSVQVASYMVAAPHGLTAFLWTRLALFVALQGLDAWAMQRVLGLSGVHLGRALRPVLYSALLYVPLHLVGMAALEWAQVPGLKLIGVAWYGVLVLGCYVLFLRREVFRPLSGARPGVSG